MTKIVFAFVFALLATSTLASPIVETEAVKSNGNALQRYDLVKRQQNGAAKALLEDRVAVKSTDGATLKAYRLVKRQNGKNELLKDQVAVKSNGGALQRYKLVKRQNGKNDLLKDQVAVKSNGGALQRYKLAKRSE
jgi:hypothetical protein